MNFNLIEKSTYNLSEDKPSKKFDQKLCKIIKMTLFLIIEYIIDFFNS